MMEPKRVLVAPLNWGLGHATRCIPIVKSLLNRNCQVVIASDGASLDLLRTEFPELKSYALTGYNPSYNGNGSLVWAMAKQLPQFIRAMKRELNETRRIVDEEGIDVILSDNRYGVRSAVLPSVLITHQLNLMMPGNLQWLSGSVNAYHRRLIRKFNYCWIPDDEQAQLAGELAKPGNQLNTRYIGPLSRLQSVSVNGTLPYDIVAILSGPEPQRSLFEQIVEDELSSSGKKCLIVRGIVAGDRIRSHNGIDIVDYLGSRRLNEVLTSAGVIISRSGYSTIMDLAKLGKKSIFVPTPGQTEQEYLASYCMARKMAFSVNQNNFNLSEALHGLDAYRGFTGFHMTEKKLNLAIDELLD